MKLSINKILVPTDFSDLSLDALDGGIFLAKSLKADLYILHVYETSINSVFEKILFKSEDEDAVKEAVKQKLIQLADKIQKEHNIKVHTLTDKGKIHNVIINKSENLDIDMVVMGTHGYNGFNKYILGTNAYRVVSNCSCPVITFTKNPDNPGLDKIILPLDLSKGTREKVDAAIHFSKIFNSSIDIVSVYSSEEDTVTINKLKAIQNQVLNYVKSRNVNVQAELIKHDDDVKAIVDYAEKKKGDLIMIMTNDYFIADYIISSESQRILNASSIPVLSIQPQLKDNTSIKPF
jgi:nucleotide-binding universal stress UspA family protein